MDLAGGGLWESKDKSTAWTDCATPVLSSEQSNKAKANKALVLHPTHFDFPSSI